ncbi:4-hydroxy-tetrahydrodipicolinate reductase [Pseudoflavonifractor capillosus]|uniref:4-hydroxy-tetrahydrodipicolinate reductase n=1 Tax=Pseudoflavonifractor capillosus TaxID=106588 RepID=UPI00195EFACE|nr:4-hydroxy-tetrahydrodipicolinate reductase [Pseudoflavonifractor capillosus]MBM6895798.1 4-hydroxy-tetrahydrodipicolinate reductase [Pseudoflavonifractor capillosus]
MQKIIISGCNGHMGRVVADICQADPQVEVVAGIDILGQKSPDFPVFSSPAACDIAADAVIDFSHPSALAPLLEMCQARALPVVLATTGYDQEQLAAIDDAARHIPVFRSANMSLGVNVLLDLVRKAAAVLGEDYDVEIVERHHHRKVDAPSGTALMIADAAAAALPYEPQYVYDRHSVRQPRQPHEIGISAVRGGTIVGDHTVIFAGRDEVIELSHHAASREVFASGAVRAAKFLAQVQAPGLYDMSHLL